MAEHNLRLTQPYQGKIKCAKNRKKLLSRDEFV